MKREKGLTQYIGRLQYIIIHTVYIPQFADQLIRPQKIVSWRCAFMKSSSFFKTRVKNEREKKESWNSSFKFPGLLEVEHALALSGLSLRIQPHLNGIGGKEGGRRSRWDWKIMQHEGKIERKKRSSMKETQE